MPKKIKERLLEKDEKRNCGIGIAAMIFAVLFGGVLIWLMRELDENIAGWKCIIVFCAYILFLIFEAVHCLQSISVFKRHENYGTLFCGIVSGAAAVAALANLQFAITLLLSSVGKTDLAQRVIGDRTFDEFIQMQRAPWVMLVSGIFAALLIGFASIAKLSENKRRQR